MIAALSTVAAAAPLADLDEAMLIPLVAIIGGISVPIVALILSYRKQKLQATLIERAIEQGLTVEEIDELLKRQGFQENDGREKGEESSKDPSFRKGFVLAAIGGAFFLAENPHFYGGAWNDGFIGQPGMFVAFLLMGLGAAFVAADLLAIFVKDTDKD